MKKKPEDQFRDKAAIKIWNNYFDRLERMIKALDSTQKEELKLEIQDHLMESYQGEQGDSEAERLLNALEKIGEPEEYLKPMLADKHLEKASQSMNPLSIIKGLYFCLFGGMKRFFVACFFFVGYILAIASALVAILKPFIPNYVGFFIEPKGAIPFYFGLIRPSAEAKDVLGFWVIPIGIALFAFLYHWLTKSLRRLKKSKK